MFSLFSQQETWYDPSTLKTIFSRFPSTNLDSSSSSSSSENQQLQLQEQEQQQRDDRLPSSDGDFTLGSSDSEGGKVETQQQQEQEQQRSVRRTHSRLSHHSSSASRSHSNLHLLPSPSSSSSILVHHKPVVPGSRTSPIGQGGSIHRTHQADTIETLDSSATAIRVRRGPSYSVNKKKEPSEISLYEFRSMDILSSDTKKLQDLSADVKTRFDLGEIPKDRAEIASKLGIPTYFVVNIQIPNRAPMSSMFKNDYGTSLVFVFVIRAEALEDSSTRLLRKFVHNEVKGRFKIIGFLDNQQELGLPSFVSVLLPKFNGIPVMINKTGTFHRHLHHFQADVDIHAFPIAARQCLSAVRSMGKHIAFRFSFLIQGETDDELPERILGVVAVKGLDFENAEKV